MLNQNLALILCLSVVVLLKINFTRATDTSNNDFSKYPRIINGTDASLYATRHQVSIRKRFLESNSFGTGHMCGGSLISDNMVLSAAHCFLNSSKGDGSFASEKEFIVVMGNLNRFDYNNNTLAFNIIKIITYANYFDHKTLADDIALLMLNGTVPAAHPTVRPIVLNEGPIADGTICQVTGWGITEHNALSDKLRTVDTQFFNVNDCRKTIGPIVSKGMICTKPLKGKGSPCNADSGGPLVCKGIQAGLVSFGACYSTPLGPTGYADVSYYKNWILEKTAHYNGTLPKFAPIPGGVAHLSY